MITTKSQQQQDSLWIKEQPMQKIEKHKYLGTIMKIMGIQKKFK